MYYIKKHDKRRLPLGKQDFEDIRKNNYLYVDKTEQIFRMLEGQYYFLSRPRRFGKSLLISTLSELFKGKKELFEGLWIYDKIEWKEHPVILISFNTIDYKNLGLKTAINKELDSIALKYELSLQETTNANKFKELIEKLAEKEKVVILIDEYDKPIIDYIDNIEQAKENRETMKSFYSIIKNSDPFIRFFFITGVSKFSQVSIFSDLNNLEDITLSEEFASIVGITEQEIHTYFTSYLERLKAKYSAIFPDVEQRMRDEYLGYSWDGKTKLYNPFLLLTLFKSMQFGDHWFRTGTPTFLMKLIKDRKYSAIDLENKKVAGAAFDKYDIENIELLSLLFQTGYLTILHHDPVRQTYTLGYPNNEVARAFSIHLLANFNGGKPEATSGLLLDMVDALEQNRPDKFLDLFQILLKGIVYPIVEVRESYFHSIFYLVAKMLGFYIDCEIMTIDGRIDAVVKTDERIYVMEFKTGNTQKAIEQIRDKGYHLKYSDDPRPKILMGLDFDIESKSLAGYDIQES